MKRTLIILTLLATSVGAVYAQEAQVTKTIDYAQLIDVSLLIDSDFCQGLGGTAYDVDVNRIGAILCYVRQKALEDATQSKGD